MKVVVVLVAVLDVALVHSLVKIPYKIWEVTPDTIWTGPAPRIYGGSEAKEGQFPYMIFALMKPPNAGLSQCSASLLSSNWVLLAAHCVQFEGLTPEDIILVGGKADLLNYIRARGNTDYYAPVDEKYFGVQERRAKKFFVHPEYDDENIEHDVALIQLDKPFDLDSKIKTIPLSENKIMQPRMCKILGWGLTAGDRQTYKLNFAENKRASTTEIGCKFRPSGPFICLSSNDAGICRGDSGSPLVCEGKVWGVASHYIAASPNDGCGNSLEEFYSELYADLKWIKSVNSEGNPTAPTNLRNLFACFLVTLWLSVKI